MEENSASKNYIGYDYLEIKFKGDYLSMYLDGYLNFGWIADENHAQSKLSIRLKRDRKIMNKPELIRLQRHFEACMAEIIALEQSKDSFAKMVSLSAGIVGTACMAGAVFAVTAAPPIIWLCILLGIPGFVGWIIPIFLYRTFARRQAKKLEPLVEAKQDELYEICEKGSKLIHE